jgi:hypothetical protein
VDKMRESEAEKQATSDISVETNGTHNIQLPTTSLFTYSILDPVQTVHRDVCHFSQSRVRQSRRLRSIQWDPVYVPQSLANTNSRMLDHIRATF